MFVEFFSFFLYHKKSKTFEGLPERQILPALDAVRPRQGLKP
jgi:hypothetical protein